MEVAPFKSVGNLFFNDSRQEIRRKLNKSFVAGTNEFNGLKEFYDYFDDIDFTVIYDMQSHVDAFQFYIYAQSPIFNGVSLLTERFIDLIRIFSDLDSTLEINFYDFTSYKYGIGAHMDYSKEREIACADSVIVFRQGYYDRLKQSIG